MFSLRRIWKYTRIDFKNWERSPRIVITFILAAILCLMLSNRAIDFADKYGTYTQLFEVFIWTFGDSSSIMLSSLLLMLLLGDIPFVTPATPYQLVRSSRIEWVLGQLLYVFISSTIYISYLLVITCVLSAHISYIGNKWSKTSALLGYSGVGRKIALPTSVKALEMSSPYACVLMIFVLMLLYAFFISAIMFLFNLYRNKYWGVVSVIVVNMYGLFLSPGIFKKIFHLSGALEYRANVAAGWLSPLNQATYYMHNFGTDYLPSITISIVLFVVIIGLLYFLICKRVRKYEFSFIQAGV
ncbi:hypothetical protein [Muricomes intestini]|jgi:hypothetical protein|uniref:hypothetical protein n=2 Tax=Muricomes intestini TaxID=1796634 RepID=UPI002FDA9496